MDTKKIRKLYMQTLGNLNKAMQLVQSQLSDLPSNDFILETNIKPYPSVKRKMLERRLKDPKELSDLARGRLFFSDQFNFSDVLNILKKLFGDNIQNIESKHEHEHGLEYHGVFHVDMNFDGTQFELQVMPIEFKPHKEFLHDIYEQLRDPKSKLTDKQKEFLKQTHNKIYKALDKESKAHRQH